MLKPSLELRLIPSFAVGGRVAVPTAAAMTFAFKSFSNFMIYVFHFNIPENSISFKNT
jgi:hypothetical protein